MAQVLGVSQYSRSYAYRQPRRAITDRKPPTRSSQKQPLIGGTAKKS